jgi:hypothetical protein
LGSTGFAFEVCLGDFLGEKHVDPESGEEINLCSDLPLNNNAEWSLIAAKICIPADLSGSLCPGIVDGVDMGVCVALFHSATIFTPLRFLSPEARLDVSQVNLRLRLIDSNRSPRKCDRLAHQFFFFCSTALVAPGPGSVEGSAVDVGLESVAGGFFFNQCICINPLASLYNRFALFEYEVACTYFDAVTIGLDSAKLGLLEFLSISATITRGLAITATPGGDIEAAFASFDGDDILTALTEFNVQALIKGELKGTLLLSEILERLNPNWSNASGL